MSIDKNLIDAVNDSNSWQGEFKINENGGVKANALNNAVLILENDPKLKNHFKYNSFASDLEVIKTFKLVDTWIYQGVVVDDLTVILESYIEENYNVTFSRRLIMDALVRVGRKQDNSYNPITDYLSDLKWDKKPRMEKVFVNFLGVDDLPVTRLITKIFFVGAVAKAFDGKEEFDFALDLVGDQKAGKTKLLRKLARGWYYEVQQDFINKDDQMGMSRAWIVNDDEMVASRNTSLPLIKRFITATEFYLRRPYAERPVELAKSMVLVRTSNSDSHLFDKTGDRRFLPLRVHRDKIKKWIKNGELSDKYIDQIWAEAVEFYLTYWNNQLDESMISEFLTLTDDQEDMLNEHRESFKIVSADEELINEYLANVGADIDFITTEEITLKAFGKFDNKTAKVARNIMLGRPEWQKMEKRVNGVKKRGYSRAPRETDE